MEELRQRQGSLIETIKQEVTTQYHIDEKKAMELNGGIDTNVYNV